MTGTLAEWIPGDIVVDASYPCRVWTRWEDTNWYLPIPTMGQPTGASDSSIEALVGGCLIVVRRGGVFQVGTP